MKLEVIVVMFMATALSLAIQDLNWKGVACTSPCKWNSKHSMYLCYVANDKPEKYWGSLNSKKRQNGWCALGSNDPTFDLTNDLCLNEGSQCFPMNPSPTEVIPNPRPTILKREICFAAIRKCEKDIGCNSNLGSLLGLSCTGSGKVSRCVQSLYGPGIEDGQCLSDNAVVEKKGANIVDVDCYTGQGLSYVGKKSKTVSGKTCQRWDSQKPHKHDMTAKGLHGLSWADSRTVMEYLKDKSISEAANYCRNDVLTEREPWCYTTSKDTRWEVCDVPKCTGNDPGIGSGDCSMDQFKCKRGANKYATMCVRKQDRCNGRKDCPDGSDEKGCHYDYIGNRCITPCKYSETQVMQGEKQKQYFCQVARDWCYSTKLDPRLTENCRRDGAQCYAGDDAAKRKKCFKDINYCHNKKSDFGWTTECINKLYTNGGVCVP